MGRLVRLGAVAALATLAMASATVSPAQEWRATPGGWVSGPLSYEATITEEAGVAMDASLRGDLLFVTSAKWFAIYDVSDPLSPQEVARERLEGYLFNEEPQTNGDILLLSRDQHPPGQLDIWDVSDPSAPERITTYEPPLREHMWTCVLDCSYAYGSSNGQIVDLSDPTAPEIVGNWRKLAAVDRVHAITEVSPGIVMTGSVPVHVLDARDDPSKPTVLATFEPQREGRIFLGLPKDVLGGLFAEGTAPARATWPVVRDAPRDLSSPTARHDRFALVASEATFTGACDEDTAGFATFDTRGWGDTGTFRPVDDHRITTNGLPTEGSVPANVFGCSAYDLDVHPAYSQARVAAVAWFEHGTRIFAIDDDGMIEELGGFVPLAGNAAQPIWVAEDVLYVVDMQRGIDILRYDPSG